MLGGCLGSCQPAAAVLASAFFWQDECGGKGKHCQSDQSFFEKHCQSDQHPVNCSVMHFHTFLPPAITLKQAARLSPLWRPAAFRHHLTMIVALSAFTVNSLLILLLDAAAAGKHDMLIKSQAHRSNVYANSVPALFAPLSMCCCASEKKLLFLMRILIKSNKVGTFYPIRT